MGGLILQVWHQHQHSKVLEARNKMNQSRIANESPCPLITIDQLMVKSLILTVRDQPKLIKEGENEVNLWAAKGPLTSPLG